ncbi:MAG: hypothetical protein HYT30_00795 [Parcubacteria group bacterium]|nr:hypothetical protein [Parcubacteria group bacterium]
MPHTKRRKDASTGFDAAAYIATYYPPVADVDQLVRIARIIRDRYTQRKALDIRSIVAEHAVPIEVVENVAVFDFQRAIARLLLKEFPRGDARILDVGGGPTIYQHIALSPSASHITHAEYSEENRALAARWVREEEGATDWDSYFMLVKRILKSDRYYVAILNKLLKSGDARVVARADQVRSMLAPDHLDVFKHHVRTCIGETIPHCDIFDPSLALPHTDLYDIVTSNFVVESATKNSAEWETGMKHVAQRVRPHGFFIHTAIKNARWYKVGGSARLPSTAISEEHLEAFCKKHGFRILELRSLNGSDAVHNGYEGMVFLAARKV